MSADQAAFVPKEQFRDPDCLGTIFVNDRRDLNVREAVTESGYIVVDETVYGNDVADIIAALDRYEAVKRVSISEAQSVVDDLREKEEAARKAAERKNKVKSEGGES